MKFKLIQYASTAARLLLGVVFLVFSLNHWLQFIPIPPPPEGSPAAGFMGAIYGSGFMTVVKALELIAALLLLSGRFVNLGLTLLGPIILNVFLFHLFIAPGNYGLVVFICVLAIIALLGRGHYLRAVFAVR